MNIFYKGKQEFDDAEFYFPKIQIGSFFISCYVWPFLASVGLSLRTTALNQLHSLCTLGLQSLEVEACEVDLELHLNF